MSKRLLAKSYPSDESPFSDSIYLSQHLQDVHSAAKSVLTSTGNLQVHALGLDSDVWNMRLHNAVLLAAAIHDLGKANDHFQGMLDCDQWPDRKGKYQGLRHEWVGIVMIASFGLGDWLRPAIHDDDLVWHAAVWAVSGHHPAYGRQSPPKTPVPGGGSGMQLLMGHAEFARCLNWIGDEFALPNPPEFPDQVLPLTGGRNAFKLIFDLHRKSMRFWNALGDEERRFVAAVKDCLVAADVVGSALPKQVQSEQKRRQWIAASFARIPKPDDIQEIIDDRLIDEHGQKHDLRPFQRDVADKAGDVTFVKAGCGTGKTLAAYNWAMLRSPRKRLYICYPTTGTATEGFRDYLVSGETAKFNSRLFHGRASVDLEMLNVRETESDEAEPVARIESLDAWSTPIVTCTVDTVLGLVQNNRRGLFAWPALAGAAFVFDEIHAYDDKLFGALLRFLAALPGVPVLLMTASLPEYRYEALKQLLKSRLAEVDGPENLETLPRYHRQGGLDNRDALPEVAAELNRGGKVLWVTNTVGRAIESADRASQFEPIIYHSRFRYEDRVRQHAKVIDAFNPKKNPDAALAICTQVAEMSLDLSATLLVTDLAPVPSLIQRLGRLNRRATPTNAGEPLPPTMPFIVVEPENEDGTPAVLPYSSEDFDLARRWLDALRVSDISQRDLADAWESDDEVRTRRPALVPSAWLDGGPVTDVLELREASPGITVIMAEDMSALTHSDPKQRKAVTEVALPMPPPPKRFNWREWKKFSGLPIAPHHSIDYQMRGANWTIRT